MPAALKQKDPVMRSLLHFCLVLAVAAVAAAIWLHAEATRYQMSANGGGAWRIDTRTGDLSYCRISGLDETPTCSLWGAGKFIRPPLSLSKTDDQGDVPAAETPVTNRAATPTSDQVQPESKAAAETPTVETPDVTIPDTRTPETGELSKEEAEKALQDLIEGKEPQQQ